MNSRADSSGQIGFADISQSVTRIPTSTFASKAKLGLRFLEVYLHKSYDYIGWLDGIFYSDFLTFFLACAVTFYLTFYGKLASILAFSLLYLASCQAFILAFVLTFSLTFSLAFFLAFYLASILTFCAAF